MQLPPRNQTMGQKPGYLWWRSADRPFVSGSIRGHSGRVTGPTLTRSSRETGFAVTCSAWPSRRQLTEIAHFAGIIVRSSAPEFRHLAMSQRTLMPGRAQKNIHLGAKLSYRPSSSRPSFWTCMWMIPLGTVPPTAAMIGPTISASSGRTTKSCFGYSVFLLRT